MILRNSEFAKDEKWIHLEILQMMKMISDCSVIEEKGKQPGKDWASDYN